MIRTGERRIRDSRISRIVMVMAGIAGCLLPTGLDAQGYPEGIIAYWKFDEGEGDVAYDSIGEKNGTIHGATWTEGQVNSALSFFGGDVVEIPYYEEWNTGGELSVEAWFKLRSQTYWAQIVGRDGYSCYGWEPYRGWMLELASTHDDLTFNVLDAPPTTTNIFSPMFEINYNEWYHAVGVFDGSLVRLFVNGQEVGDGTPRTGPVNPSTFYGITIGSDAGCFPFPVDGVIDEVAIYSRALTPHEILRHYENGLLGFGYQARLTCVGFQPPMASGTVTARGNRALPLKAVLFDADGYEMTDTELPAPPVIQIMFQSATGGEPMDVTGDALPVGLGTEGNEFEYNVAAGVWQYNLKTRDYTAAGTYSITMVSGDETEYLIDPTCEAAFERQE